MQQPHGIEIERIFEDKASGKNFERPHYQAMKLALREGDTLIIKELDRLGRNMEQIKTNGRISRRKESTSLS
jgi:Resolvase, N terminal domain.